MISFIQKYPRAVLLFVCMLMLVPHLGLIQTNIMEARNLITAREMVNNGHWIFTTMDGMPRYEKPPLPTWLTAFVGYAAGFQNMFLLRLPVALVTFLLVYFFYRLIANMQLKNHQPLNASLILITSFYIFFAGRDNQWDMYTHAFMVASIFYLFKAFRETKNLTVNIILSGIFFGCSFLSKGPVSLYALFLSFLISYLIIYRGNVGRNFKLVLFVLIIGLIIGFSWPLYVKYFDVNAAAALSKQTENWGSYEVKPFYYYWSFFTQSGIWAIPSLIALMYFYLRTKVTDVKAYTFSFLWTMTSLILLSVIPEKKARYTLPILIPMAMNTSFYIQYLIQNFKHIQSRLEKGLVYFSSGLIALIGFTLPFVIFFLFRATLKEYIFWYALLAIISFFCTYIIMKGLFKKQFANTFYITVLFMCGIVITVIPLSRMYYNNKNYYAAANLDSVEKDLNIKTYEDDEFVPEIIWDYGKPIPSINNGKKFIMPKDSVFGLLTYPDKINAVAQQYKNYTFTKYTAVDLNEISEETKGYNTRLVKDYYIVKKLN